MASNVVAEAAITAAKVKHDIESGDALAHIGGDDDDDDADKEWYEKLGTVMLLVLGMGTASFVFNLLAMILVEEASPIVFVAGVIAMLIAPVVMKRQFDLDGKDSMRNLQNKLRDNVNVLSTQNNRLCTEVNQFADQVNSLKKCETELADIVKDNEEDVNTVVKLVKENGQIIDKLKDAIKGRAVAQVIDSFLDSDRDESNHLDEREVEILSHRLEVMRGVKVNNDLFVQEAIKDSSLSGILAILQGSLKTEAETPKEERIFSFALDEIE